MSSIARVGKEICDILGIRNCQTLSITLRHDFIPIVTAKCIIKDKDKLDAIKAVICRYRLVPHKPKQP